MILRLRLGDAFLLILRLPALDSIQRLLAWGIIIATVVNLLVALLLGKAIQSSPRAIDLSPEEKMVILNLLEDKEIEKAKKLMENPKANAIRPEETEILSDRNSKSDIVEPPKESILGNNLEAGKAVSDPGETTEEAVKNPVQPDIEPGRNTVAVQPFPFLKKQGVLEQVTGRAADPGQSMEGVSYNLNTYQWEFAPYMLKWKNKMINKWYDITSKIFFNPYANVGTMQIWVKMDRRGNLVDSRILSYTCDKAFVPPAYASVVNVFPLEPLPDGFPEELLETTWTITIFNN